MAKRSITMDELDQFEIDDEDGRLYFAGKAVVFERRIGLEGPTFWVLVVATLAALLAAIWPITVHFGVWGPSKIEAALPVSGAASTTDFLEKRP